MAFPKFKDSDLKELISQVESELPSLLKKSQEDLAKAAKDEEPEEKSPATESAPPAAEESSPPAEGSAPPAAPPSPSPAASPEASASPAPHAEPDGDEGGAPMDPAAQAAEGQGPIDPMALEAEYDGLPDDELMMHYQAAKNAVFKRQRAPGPEASAPAGAPPPAPPAPGPAGPPPAMKGEMNSDTVAGKIPKGGPGTDEAVSTMIARGGKPTDEAITKAAMKFGGSGGQIKAGHMGKSEDENPEIAQLRKSQADMEETVGKLADLLFKNISQPQRKAVTSVSALMKPGDAAPASKPAVDPSSLSKTEIREKLSEAAKRLDLKKSDRDAITSWCINPDFGTEKIAHLLQDAR